MGICPAEGEADFVNNPLKYLKIFPFERSK
jgi:hypothetical protein